MPISNLKKSAQRELKPIASGLLTPTESAALGRHTGDAPVVTLVAQGGYGRGHLNPGSDLDLLFLLPRSSHKIPKTISSTIEEILYTLWDAGFKVGHACRSIEERVSL